MTPEYIALIVTQARYDAALKIARAAGMSGMAVIFATRDELDALDAAITAYAALEGAY
jgi:hypothetical protein